MSISQPQTISNELLQQISKFDLDNEPSEFEAKLFLREAEKLKKSNPSESWMLIGIIQSLLFKYDKAKSSFEKSIAHSPLDFEVVILNYVKALRLLGKFEEALEVSEKYASNDSFMLLENAFLQSLNLGLFNKASSYSKKLKAFSYKDESYLGHLKNMIVSSNELGISESNCSAIYLLVLKSIHSEKILSVKSTVAINYDHSNALILLFYIDANASTIANIELDIAEKLAELDIAPVLEHKITPVILKGAN